MLNARSRREEKQAVSLQPVLIEKQKNFMREINRSCINGKELTIVWVGWAER